ncbi:hypothetical protein KY329_03025 [Candidatus Woesearchaeota archaeon]|nr:hypothetical protein [Candidatus Woesearchaeota archaeon]
MHGRRYLLGILVFFALLATLIFSGPSITGYVATETFSKPLNIHIAESQRFFLEADQDIALSALAVSGKVDGDGLVNVYLVDDEENRLLVFSNKAKSSSAMKHITGLAVVDVKLIEGKKLELIESLDDNYVTSSGSFVNQCEETCLIDPSAFAGNSFTLDFIVEPGTQFTLTNVRYSVAQS